MNINPQFGMTLGKFPQRSSFDLSEDNLTAFDMDGLYPVYLAPTVPGDTFNMKAHMFMRLATPLYPIMDNIYVTLHFFWCPWRVVWPNVEKMLGAQDDPDASIDVAMPPLSSPGSVKLNSYPLCDYFGLPYDQFVDNDKINALPFRMYHKVWNDFYRAQALQAKVVEHTADGPSGLSAYPNILKRGKRFDYFTAALPAPQRGEAVSLPLGSLAPVGTSAADGAKVIVDDFNSSNGFHLDIQTNPDAVYDTTAGASNLEADLSAATAATLNDLRLAAMTQQILELDARVGTRYEEVIRGRYGVDIGDLRVQKPLYLGGGTQRVNITPVANTSATGATNQGDLAGFGTVSGKVGFTKSFNEFGYIMGLVSSYADIKYWQGVERHWGWQTRYDVFHPEFVGIGEQAVFKREIYADETDGKDFEAFGYMPRYDELRHGRSKVTSIFRPNKAGTLAAWHLAEEYTSRPVLSDAWIESNHSPAMDRAIAVPSEPHFLADFYFNVKAARPLPTHGIPGVGRF